MEFAQLYSLYAIAAYLVIIGIILLAVGANKKKSSSSTTSKTGKNMMIGGGVVLAVGICIAAYEYLKPNKTSYYYF